MDNARQTLSAIEYRLTSQKLTAQGHLTAAISLSSSENRTFWEGALHAINIMQGMIDEMNRGLDKPRTPQIAPIK